MEKLEKDKESKHVVPDIKIKYKAINITTIWNWEENSK